MKIYKKTFALNFFEPFGPSSIENNFSKKKDPLKKKRRTQKLACIFNTIFQKNI